MSCIMKITRILVEKLLKIRFRDNFYRIIGFYACQVSLFIVFHTEPKRVIHPLQKFTLHFLHAFLKKAYMRARLLVS